MTTTKRWNEEDDELDEALQDVRFDKQYLKFKERDRKNKKERTLYHDWDD